MKTILLTYILAILFLTGCASSNSNLDELDKMELQDQMMQNGQTFKLKQLKGDFCHNPSY